MSKRIISFILTACMLFSLVPATVFAAENTVTPTEAAVQIVGSEKVDAVVDEMKDAGLLNFFGNYSGKDSLNIDGENVSLTDLPNLINTKKDSDKINVEGKDMTVAELKDMLSVNTILAGQKKKGGADFPQELVDEIQKLAGDKYDARTMLEQMYNTGMIDETGNPVLGDTFVVDGKTMTVDELKKEAELHDYSEAVTIDGQDITWGYIQQLFFLKEELRLYRECADSDAVMTQEHIDNMASLYESFLTGNAQYVDEDGNPISMQGADTGDIAYLTGKNSAVSLMSVPNSQKLYLKATDTAGEYKIDTAKSADIINKYGLDKDIAYRFEPVYVITSGSDKYVEIVMNEGSFKYSPAPNMTISYEGDTNGAVTEGSTLKIKATIDRAVDYRVAVDYRAVAGSFDAASGSGTIEIPKGQTTAEADIAVGTSTKEWNGKTLFYVQAYNAFNCVIGEKGVAQKEFSVEAADEIASKIYRFTDKDPDVFNSDYLYPQTASTMRYYSQGCEGADKWANDERGVGKIAWVDRQATSNTGFAALVLDTSKIDWPSGATELTMNYNILDLRVREPYNGKGKNIATNLKWNVTIYRANELQIAPDSPNAKVLDSFESVTCPTYWQGADITESPSKLSARFYNNLQTLESPWGLYNPTYYMAQNPGAIGNPDMRSVIISKGSKYIYFDINGTCDDGIFDAATASEINANVLLYFTGAPNPAMPEFSVQPGTYYPGQQVPVTVKLKSKTKVNRESASLTVNHKALVPVEENGTITDTLTFLYTVEDLDALGINVTDFEFSGTDKSGTPIPYDKNTDFVAKTITDAKLNTPRKTDSFDIAKRTVEITDSGTAKMTIPIIQTADNIQWITSNISNLATTEPHIKSMYASADGGATRLPVKVTISDQTYTGTTSQGTPVNYDEVPLNIYVEFSPENSTEAYSCGNITIFMDQNLDSTEDYTEGDKLLSTAGAFDKKWTSLPYFLVPSVLMDDSKVTVSYDATWKKYAKGSSDSSIKSLNVAKLLEAGDNLSLTYTVADDAIYTYADGTHFEWESSDTNIATVQNVSEAYSWKGTTITRKKANITFTGNLGDVTFTLKAKNGGGTNTFTVTSAKITVSENPDPYFAIPLTSKSIIALQNETATVLFANNIARRNADEFNQAETDYTINVYESDASGNKANDTAIYTAVVKGSKENCITSITIPENKLSNISESGAVSYRAEISATYANSPAQVFSDYAVIKVKVAPVKVALAKLESNYLLSGKDVTLNFDITGVNNASSTKGWYYTVTRKSDNTIVKTEPSTDFSKKSITLDKSILTVADDKLKEIYTVTIYASNDPTVDGYSVGSTALYIYNGGAIDILVNESNSIPAENINGDNVTVDNTKWMNAHLSADGKTLDLGKYSLNVAQLRQDVNLSTIVSLNFGSYVWGLVSDRIQWKVTGGDNTDLYYKQAGMYSDIDAALIPSFMPISEFMLAGSEDEQVTITATHANTGVTSTVNVDVNTLEDKFYLFQFYPLAETTLVYTNGNNEEVTVKSDGNGQLALFEPSSIKAGSVLYYSSKSDELDYIGMMYENDLYSKEKNVALEQLYPVNNVRLNRAADASIYLLTEDGTPYANKKVTVRGGAYVNWEYCPRADLFTTTGVANVGADDKSNGLDEGGIEFTTDENGCLHVYFNIDQMSTAGHHDITMDYINYAFELQFEAHAYRPEVFEVHVNLSDEATKNCTKVVSLTANPTGVKAPYLTQTILEIYEGGIGRPDIVDLEKPQDKYYGASTRYSYNHIYTTAVLWGYDDLVTKDPVTGYADVTAASESIKMLYGVPGKDDFVIPGQDKSSTRVYEFSTIPFTVTDYDMTAETYGGVPDGEGYYDWDNAWLPVNESTDAELCIFKDGKKFQTFSLPYKFINNITRPEKTSGESQDMKDVSNKAGKEIRDRVDFKASLSDIVPGGDMISKGVSFFSSIASGGDYGLTMSMIPTADPTIYNMIVRIGAADPGEGDTEMEFGYGLDPGPMSDAVSKATEAYDSYKEKKAAVAKGKDPDKEGEPSPVSFVFGGAVICRATYDPDTEKWEIAFTGGELNGKVNVKVDFTKNFPLPVMSIPATISFSAEANLGARFGAKTQMISGSEEFGTCVTVEAGAAINAFVGLGFDYTIIALKIGIEGSVDFMMQQKFLMTAGKNGAGFKQGQYLEVNGEVGLKFVATLLLFKYEKTFCSVGFGWDKSWNDYDSIIDYWTGQTVSGQTYSATLFGDGTVMMTLSSSGMEDRAYLQSYDRVWYVDTKKGDDWFETLQSNSYSNANPVFSEDGQILVYVSDSDSENIYDTAASWAKWNGSGYTDMGAITKKATDTNETYGYGDSNLTVSGKDGKYYATWVKQTAVNQKEDGDDSEVSNDDVIIALNSTEVVTAFLDTSAGNTTWTEEKITDNSAPDLAPRTSTAKGKSLLAWRSVYNSSSGTPLDFDVDNNLLYKTFDGSTWTENKIAYNGTSGNVQALETAMATGGASIIVYTVKTANDLDSKDLETFYTYIAPDGTTETVRLTTDNNIDENAKVVSLGDKFIIAWYSKSEDNADVRLMAINADGTINTAFPESINGVDKLDVTPNFELAAATSGKISDLAIGWSAINSEDSSYTLYAVKFYENNGKIGVTSPQVLAKTNAHNTLDYFDVYAEGDTVYAAALLTDYSDGLTKEVDQVAIEDIVKNVVVRDDYDTDEAYEKAKTDTFENLKAHSNSNALKISAAEGRSNMMHGSYEFKEKLTVNSVSYDKANVIPGLSVPVIYTVTNDGISPINNIKVGGVEKTDVLNPGETATITVNYDIPKTNVADVAYAVEATTVNSIAVDAVMGTLKFNTPDIGISKITVVKSESCKRPVLVQMFNDSYLKLTESGKTAKLEIYLDANMSVLYDEIDITNLALVDAGAATKMIELDVNDILAHGYYGDGYAEIPENGIKIYARAVLYNDDGTLVEEYNKGNNIGITTLKGLVKDENNKVTISSGYKQDADELVLNADIQNDSIQNAEIKNLRATLYDAQGNKLAQQITYDGTNESIINLNGEEKTAKTFNFANADINGEVYNVKVMATGLNAKVTFSMGELATEAAPNYSEADVTISQKATRPLADPENANYYFKGWYSDAACKTEFDFDKAITDDTTVYAKWEVKLATSINDVTVSGERLTALSDTEITVGIMGGLFTDDIVAGTDVTAWMNLPSGLTATLKNVAADKKSLTITLSGTPTVTKKSGTLSIAVPFGKVTPDATLENPPVNVACRENENAAYAIMPTTLNLNETAQSFNYTGETKAFALTETNNYTKDGYTVKYQQNGSDATPIAAGSYDVVITRPEDALYAEYSNTVTGGLVIDMVDVNSVILSATPIEGQVYDANVTLSAEVTGVTTPTGNVQFYVDEETYEAPVALANGKAQITWASPDAYEHKIKVEYLGDNNFNTKYSPQNNYSIAKGTFVENSDFTAVGSDVIFDGDEHSISVTLEGKAQQYNANLTYSTDGETFASDNPTFRDYGTYTVYYKITQENYNDVLKSCEVKIAQRTAELAWAGYETKVYDDTAMNVTASVTNLGNGDSAVLVTVENGTQQDAGTHTATATALDNTNYKLPEAVTQDYTITKRPVRVIADAVSKVRNTDDPALTYSVEGGAEGSDDVIATLSRIAGETAGKYEIVLSETNPNYTVSYIGNYITVKANEAEEVKEVKGKITGTVTGGDANTIITLLYKGKTLATQYGTSFEFLADDGLYNIVVRTDNKKVLATVTLKTPEVAEGETSVPATATVNVDLSSAPKSTDVEINSSDEMQNVVVQGLETAMGSANSIKLVLNETEQPAAIKSKLSSRAVALANFDMTAYENGTDEANKVTTVAGLFTLTMPIPEAAKGRTVNVYRTQEEATTDTEGNPVAKTVAAELPIGLDKANENGEYAEVNAETGEIILHVKTPAYYSVSYVRPGGGGGSSTFKITVTQTEGGKIAPETMYIGKGNKKEFTITPNTGYEISDVLVDGKSVGTVASYLFENVTTAHTIKATFTKTEAGGGTTGGGTTGGGTTGGGTTGGGTTGGDTKPTTWTNPFSDVNTNDWFYAAVKYVNENGLMKGVTDTEFAPNADITRAMFVTVLYRMENEPEAQASSFEDVESGSYYDKAVGWASANGIVNGVSAEEFAPNSNITREQMSAIAYRYAKFKGYEQSADGSTNYSDNAQISDYAKEAVAWAADKKIMSGNTDGTFAPVANSTRSQAAAVVQRIIENLK